jgi:Zn-dependent protease
MIDPAQAATWYVAFLFSTTCHEAGHAWVAKLGGDNTAYEGGQVSLNPLPHIRREPFGMVIVPILSLLLSGWAFGWASAPYDPYWAQRHPRRAGLMAAAGPAANFVLMLISIALLRVGIAAGWFSVGAAASLGVVALNLLFIMAILNALLGTFNLLPVPPLDGASIVEAFGSGRIRELMLSFRSLPIAGMIGLVIAWQVFPLLAGPVQRMVYWLIGA